jgi:hypothetical protein
MKKKLDRAWCHEKTKKNFFYYINNGIFRLSYDSQNTGAVNNEQVADLAQYLKPVYYTIKETSPYYPSQNMLQEPFGYFMSEYQH